MPWAHGSRKLHGSTENILAPTMYPVRHKLTACALAGLYALFACAGQGLHALAHLSGACDSCSDSQCLEEIVCSCGEGNCPFTQREASQPGTPPAETSFTLPGKPGHDPHTCSVCRLLSQLKTADAGYAQTLLVSHCVDETLYETEQLLLAAATSLYDARGPPAVG